MALCLALLLAANLLAYAPSIYAPFVFDDFPNLLNNPAVREAGAGRDSLLHLAVPSLAARRPLAFLTFALNLRGFGLDPLYFHLVNLVIHICNSWLLFFLLLSLLKILKGRRFSTCALAGALLWSLHPVQVQAVTYLIQRMTSLATLFYLLALLLWLHARRQLPRTVQVGLFLAALVSAGLGFLTKETVVTLPLAIVLLEGVVLGKARTLRERWAWLGKAALVLAAYGLLLLAVISKLNWDITENVTRLSTDWTTRLGNQPALLWHYLSLLVFPDLSRLCLDPEWVSASGFLQPWTTLPALLALAALIGASLCYIRSWPLAAFALLFFLLTLLPESIVPLDPVFEHRLYLPSSWLLGATGAAWVWPGPRRRLRLALLAAALLGLGFLTFSRNCTWADDVRLWRDTVKKSPGSSRAWFNLGKHLADLGQYPQAVRAFDFSLKLQPCRADALSNLGGAYLGMRRFDAARQSFADALKCDPAYAIARAGNKLADALENHPDLRSPLPPPAGPEDLDGPGKLYRRGYSRLREGRYPEGFRDLEAAIKGRPPFPEAAALLEQARQTPPPR